MSRRRNDVTQTNTYKKRERERERDLDKQAEEAAEVMEEANVVVVRVFLEDAALVHGAAGEVQDAAVIAVDEVVSSAVHNVQRHVWRQLAYILPVVKDVCRHQKAGTVVAQQTLGAAEAAHQTRNSRSPYRLNRST
jgi:hypothetical protein